MAESLLRTKLFAPPPRPNLVPRASLLEKLNAARQAGASCALVSAPAGFGKTTLVADWARASGLPFAWLTLDEGDNDPLRFWRYLDAALQTIDARLGQDLRPALYAAQAPAIEPVIAGLVNDVAALEKEIVLVLEDYHVIEHSQVHAGVNFLLDHLPPQMRLAITARSDPPLNLARRRGRGQLVEVRAADLRFTPEETAAFLNQAMQLGLAEEDVEALGHRTDGWITGLHMAALSLQDESDRHAFVAAFSGDDRYVADYLMEEVFQRQLVEFQRFLLQTSILSRLSASLCDAVTGREDSRAMLSALERANLFILPLDNRREWFRYHPLFADLLRRRLLETWPAAEVAELHHAASAWHEAQGDILAAVQHARLIPDESRMLQTLEANVGRFFQAGELPQLYEIARLIPPGLRQTSPFLCIAVAWAGLASGHQPEIAGWLSAVEAHFGMPAQAALDDPALDLPRRAALLEVLIVRLQSPASHLPAEQRAHLLAIRDQLNALPPEQACLFNSASSLKPVIAFDLGLNAESTGEVALAEQVLTEAADLSRQAQNSTLFHLAIAHLASVQFVQGQLHRARQTHEQALAEARSLGQSISPYIALSHAGLGALHYEWNDLALAESYFSQGLAYARLWNQWESLAPIALGRARLKQRAGQTQAALDILGEWATLPIPELALNIEARAACLRSRTPERDSAAAWLAGWLTTSRLEPSPANETCLLDVARLMISLQRLEEAVALIQAIVQFAEGGGRGYTLVQAQAVLAAALSLGGDARGAQACLAEALRLAEPEGCLSTFLDEGEVMQALLRQALKQSRLDPQLSAHAEKLLAAFEPAARPAPPASGLAEPLSERELEVLGHIAEGLSNPEIASRLYLSPNTLKAHTQNIFAKLDVHNRVQAVKRARELGLIK